MTIPHIDLAHERHRQVVVDRHPEQYLGHVTTALLEDNRTVYATYPIGHGQGQIILKRSDDAGLSWSERLPVPANWSSSLEVPTIHRVVDKQGVKRLILFSGLYPIRMAVSEDDGASWSPLNPIGDFGGIVAMSALARLKNGDYMAMFHDDGRFLRGEGTGKHAFIVYKIISSDGGLTWNQPVEVTRHEQAHLCEPGLIRSPDGNRLAVLLRENSRQFNAFVIFSDDEGETWTQPRELPDALTGDRHIGRYAPDGRLLISFRDESKRSPWMADWVAWVGTFEDIERGSEGQYKLRLMHNREHGRRQRGDFVFGDCAYPGLEVLPDGTFVTTTYGHWTADEPPYIVSVRLKLGELDAKNLAGGA